MDKVKKIAKIFFGLPLTVIAFFFIGKILYDALPQIKDHFLNAEMTLIFIGLFFMLLFFMVRAIAWTKVLEFYGENEKGTLKSIYLYSLAETKRYVPGNIFSFVSRVQKFSTEKLPTKTIVKALALEAIVMVISASAVSLPAIFGLSNLNYYLFSLLLILIVLSVFLGLVYKNIFKLKTLFLSVFPKKNLFDYITVISISSLAWFFFGLGNFFFMVSIFPADPNLILKLCSIFVLAWLAGYLSFIAPMGLGVREAVLVFLLAPFIPVYAGAAVAVFTRLLFVLSEIVFLAISSLLHRVKAIEKKVNALGPILIVAASALSYSVYFNFVSITRHLNFYSGKFDLGNMENTVWNTLHGNFFIFSNPDGANEMSRLSTHADFILLFFTPFYAIYPSVNLLLVTQTLVVALGGFFVFLIAKKVINSEKIAVLFSIGYFLNFFVQEQNIFDFHAISMATTFLLGAFYYILQRNFKLTVLFLVLAVLTKENVYLVSAVFGIYIFFTGKRFLGTGIFLVSAAVFLLLMGYLIPQARGNEHFALEYLAYLGNSPLEIIFSPILKPNVFFPRLFSFETIEYIKVIFMPVGYLSFLAPQYLLFMLPDFFINVLSDNPNLRSIQFHYGALLVPFIYISAIYGAKKIISRKFVSKNLIFYSLLFFIVYSTWLYSPLPGTKNADVDFFKTNPDIPRILSEVQKIPAEKSVSATNNIAAHLVQREKIYVIPNGIETVDYLVFYKTDMELAQEYLAHENFIVIFNDYDLIILKRITLPERAYIP